jgi:hypothetical protein
VNDIPRQVSAATRARNPHLYGEDTERVIDAVIKSESTLHEEIAEYCSTRRWVCFHSRMDRKQHATLGMPDFVVATDDGRTIYAEAKQRGGKCTPSQNAILHWLKSNGQIVGVVTSLEEFKSLAGA